MQPSFTFFNFSNATTPPELETTAIAAWQIAACAALVGGAFLIICAARLCLYSRDCLTEQEVDEPWLEMPTP